jgi:transposase
LAKEGRVMIRVVLNDRQVRELEAMFAGTDDVRLRGRAQIVLMAHRGRPRGQIAADVGVTTRTVQRWLNAYCEGGAAALLPRKAPGAPQKIPESLAGEVRRWVIRGPAACGLDRANWTHEELAAQLGRVHGVRVKKSAMHAFCRRHGIRPYRPSYRFLRGDPERQAAASSDLAALKKGHRTAS